MNNNYKKISGLVNIFAHFIYTEKKGKKQKKREENRLKTLVLLPLLVIAECRHVKKQ